MYGHLPDGRPTRPRLLTLALVAVAACVTAVVGAQSVDPLPRVTASAARLSSEQLSAATALLQQHVDAGKSAGVVAMLAREGRLAYVATVGVQDLTTRAPMSERTLFRIYSMTKPITAVAVMMLLEQGVFTLDEPVSKYLPEFAGVTVRAADGSRAPARAPTVRDLLLHTSGLEHRTSAVYRDAQVRARTIGLPQFVKNIVQVPLMEDPGTRFRYSESTTVLGRLVEIWSGQRFDTFLQTRIFTPLRMPDTGFYATPAQRPRLATVYAPAPASDQRPAADDQRPTTNDQLAGLKPVEIEALPFTEPPTLLEGAVGLLSTGPDFLRFAQMLLNRGELDGVRLLRADTVDAMVGNGLPDAVLAARGNGVMGWGLGNVNVVMKPESLRYPANRGEYGWDGTAGTIFWNDPVSKTVLLLLTQNSPADPDNLRARFKTAIASAIAVNR